MSSQCYPINPKPKREGQKSGEKKKQPVSKEDVFGPEKTRDQVMEEIKAEAELFEKFQNLSPELQEELLEFAMGVRGLKVTYDPVFKKIFNPESRPERLEEFISLCLRKKARILKVLPNESERLTEEGSLLIMDMLVQLASKSLVNVEIQRVGYLFPGERRACYSSDLVMRQYSQAREKKRKKKKKFSYKDIKDVYTIVLIQRSTEEYLHHFSQTSNTGLKLNLLQEYFMIPLDIFQESLQNRRKGRKKLKTKLEAWLTFIGSDRPDDILEVVRCYPEFRELYQEVFEFRYQKRELIEMYSKALSILDANTVEYMVEQQKKEIRKLTKALENKTKALENKTKALEEEHREVERLHALLEAMETKK